MSKDIMNTAFIFPGQGSQDIGMGKSLYLNSIAARDVFDEVDEILGRNLSDLMFEGDKDELTRTENAQPAILATSIALWKSIEETTDTISTPSIVAGHSLGEYSALTVAGVFSIADAVKLVLERCKQMQMACDKKPGGMVALIGLDEVTALEICNDSGTEISTVKTPQQIIIGGDHASLATALDLATARGAKKAISLKVDGAFHSCLMSPAKDGLKSAMKDIEFYDPVIPIIGNVSAKPLNTVDEIKKELEMQLTSCVQWNNSMKFMMNTGVNDFFEIGHGKILSGIMKRIDGSTSVTSISNFDDVEKYAA